MKGGLPVGGSGSKLPGVFAECRRRSMDLKGAVAVVTGGNGGLGERICHALAKEGVNVAVAYAKSREQAEGVADALSARYQVAAAAFACDVTDGDAVTALPEHVMRRFGRLDILVNDAAFNRSIAFPDLDGLTLEIWEKIMAVWRSTSRDRCGSSSRWRPQ
jgi:ketoreductase RED2